MVKLKNPLFSLSASRKIGDITLRTFRKLHIAEKTPVIDDVKSYQQLTWRTMFLMARDLWHALSAAEKRTWEAAGTVRHMTGYAWFMSQALRPNPGIYLPLLGGTMQGDIDMAGFKIEDLPDPAAAQEPVTKAFHDVAANLPTHGAEQHTNITKTIFMHIMAGSTDVGIFDGTYHYHQFYGDPNQDKPITYFTFKVPDDFVSFTRMEAVWWSSSVGNIYWEFKASYSASGETCPTHSETPGLGVTAAGGVRILNIQEAANPLTLVNLAKGDYLGVNFRREGTDPLDTLTFAFRLLGLRFTYVADQ